MDIEKTPSWVDLEGCRFCQLARYSEMGCEDVTFRTERSVNTSLFLSSWQGAKRGERVIFREFNAELTRIDSDLEQ
jgi:hypothetical protein